MSKVPHRKEFEEIRNTKKVVLATAKTPTDLGNPQHRVITAYVQRVPNSGKATVSFTFKVPGDHYENADGQKALDRLINYLNQDEANSDARYTITMSDSPEMENREIVQHALLQLRLEGNFPTQAWKGEDFVSYSFFE